MAHGHRRSRPRARAAPPPAASVTAVRVRERFRRRGVGRPRVYLHIGAMKTGTTYLQQVLSLNKADLAAAGYLFPGEQWTDQTHGVQQILKARDGSAGIETWQLLVDEMLAFQGEASILSMEFLSFADPEKAARVVASFPGAEVHAILTVRDARGAIPAQWQTLCRNGGRVSLPRFVQAVRQLLDDDGAPSSPALRSVRRTQDVVRMIDVWRSAVGSDRLHVVTLPPSGSDPRLLWERFAGVVGLDPAVATHDPGRRNTSLGHPSSELLRRVSAELSDVPQRDFQRLMRALARRSLAARSGVEAKVTLTPRGQQQAARWNRAVRAAIHESGAHWVGDPEDLPVAPADPSAKSSRPRPEDLLAAAATARDGLLEIGAQRESAHASTAAGDAPAPAPGGPATTPDRWLAAPDPVQAAVRELADLVRSCIAAPPPADEAPRQVESV